MDGAIKWVTYCNCLLIVKTNKTQKYSTRIGQYTGTSNTVEKVMKKEIRVARVVDSLHMTWWTASAVAKSTRRKEVVPKLPFRKSANEWAELVVTSAGKWRGLITFATFQFVCH
jgi:hypothetical protein